MYVYCTCKGKNRANGGKRLGGMKSKSGDLVYQIQVEGFSDLSQLDQANATKVAFLERLEEYPLPSPLPASAWRNHPISHM